MALTKITPTHHAIQAIDDAITKLKSARVELVSTLPVTNKRPVKTWIKHPLTGKKVFIKERR